MYVNFPIHDAKVKLNFFLWHSLDEMHSFSRVENVVFEDGKLSPLQCSSYPVLSVWPVTRAARTQESPELHDLLV